MDCDKRYSNTGTQIYYEGQPHHYDALPEEEKAIVQDWIAKHISPRKTVNGRITSYGLKHRLTADTGLYIFNGVMKGAMDAAGYQPVRSLDLNWSWPINYKPEASQD